MRRKEGDNPWQDASSSVRRHRQSGRHDASRDRGASRRADAVCAEDTRVTGKLLAHFGIEKAPRTPRRGGHHATGGRIAERIAAGETVAFAATPGMPGVSDPGARLIETVRREGGRIDVRGGFPQRSRPMRGDGIQQPAFFSSAGSSPQKDSERRETLHAFVA